MEPTADLGAVRGEGVPTAPVSVAKEVPHQTQKKDVREILMELQVDIHNLCMRRVKILNQEKDLKGELKGVKVDLKSCQKEFDAIDKLMIEKVDLLHKALKEAAGNISISAKEEITKAINKVKETAPTPPLEAKKGANKAESTLQALRKATEKKGSEKPDIATIS